MTRKYIYIFSDLIFKVTNCHYRISHSKVTNKNGKIISVQVKAIFQKETEESHIWMSIKNFQIFKQE